jgi:preprotein translocase subunit Sss1
MAILCLNIGDKMSKAQEIKTKLEDAGIRYWAGDNISEVLQKGDKEELIEGATVAFEGVLDALM